MVLQGIINFFRSLFVQINFGSGFSGGLNNVDDPSEIQTNEAQDTLNFRVNKDGSIRKRTGFSTLLASPESSPILAEAQIDIGDSKYDIIATKSDIKLKTGTTTSSLMSNLNGIDSAQFHEWNNKLFFANGVDNIKKVKLNRPFLVYCGVLPGLSSLGIIVSDIAPNQVIRYSLPVTNPVSLTCNGTHIFSLGSGVVTSYTSSLTPIGSSASFPSSSRIQCNSQYLYVNNGAVIYQTDMSLNVLHSLTNPTIIGFCCNESYFFYMSTSDNMIHRTNPDLTSNTFVAFPIGSSFSASTIICNDNNVFCYDASNSTIYKYDMSLSLISSFHFAQSPYVSCDNNYIYSPAQPFNIFDLSGNFINSQLVNSLPFGNRFGVYGSIAKDWYDICSPYRPIPDISSGITGSSKATSTYRTTWYDSYGGLETSGGLESYSIIPGSKKVEVFFDFNSDTQLVYEKSDTIIPDLPSINKGACHRVYRKEGTNPYRLVATYPVYFNYSKPTSFTGVAPFTFDITVDSARGLTYTNQFYLIFGDGTGEIVQVTNIAGNVFTIVRGNPANSATWIKGTYAVPHTSTTNFVMYTFSFFDDVSSASLQSGVQCPVKNSFVPVAKYLDHSQTRLLLASSNDRPSTVWWSELSPNPAFTGQGDEDIIRVEDNTDIGTQDGGSITAMRAYINNNIYIWKNRAMWFITGVLSQGLNAGSYQVLKFDGTTGCAAEKSIVEIPGGLLYLSHDGIMFFNGTHLLNISKFKINPTIKTINWNYAYLAHATYNPIRNEYWLHVPTGSSITCNKVIVLNVLLSNLSSESSSKCYSIFDWAMCSSIKTLDSNNNTVIWAGDYNNQLCLLDNTDADNGVSISAYHITKNNGMLVRFMRRWISIIENHKGFRRILVDFLRLGNWTFNVQYSVDGGSYSSIHTVNTDNSVKGTIRDIDKWSIDDRGHFITIKYSCVGINQPVQIYSQIWNFKEHKIRG